MKQPALDLERFAALSAELEAGVPAEELCAREGVSMEAFSATREHWLGKLADEATRRRFDLTNRYNASFVRARRALSSGPRLPRRAPPLAAPQPRDDDTTREAIPSRAKAALPFSSQPSSPQEPLARAGAHAARRAGRTPPRAPDDDGQTIDAAPRTRDLTLPFTTVAGDSRARRDDADDADDADEPTIPLVPSSDRRGDTEPLFASPAVTPRGRIAAPASTPAPAAELSLEQYAAACAEMPANAARAAAVRARYGIPSAEAWVAMTRRWDARLRADPALYRRLMELVAEFGRARSKAP
jgi:hypothetical protein